MHETSDTLETAHPLQQRCRRGSAASESIAEGETKRAGRRVRHGPSLTLDVAPQLRGVRSRKSEGIIHVAQAEYGGLDPLSILPPRDNLQALGPAECFCNLRRIRLACAAACRV